MMPATREGSDWVLSLSPEHALKEFLAEMDRIGDWPLYDDFYVERLTKHPDPLVWRFAELYFERQEQLDDTEMLAALEAVEKKYKQRNAS